MTDAVSGRAVPQLTDLNQAFWTSGADGVLTLQRCTSCDRLVHPPALVCPHDHGELVDAPVSGRAVVESWTVNEHPWFSWLPPRLVMAFVTPVEDERVRLLTNLVDVDPDEVTIGQPVAVRFERVEADDDVVFVPLFAPEPV